MTLDTRIAQITGRAVPVPGHDIDTDRIMPARYLRCVTFENIGQYTFQDERFGPDGKPKAHPFNDPRHKGASILIVNKNFGCGSSREHAPQGIYRWGIRAIIGESFAEIFAGNCTAIGLPAVTAAEADVRALMAAVEKNPTAEVRVDLEKKQASAGDLRIAVDLNESARRMFLEGTWDSTATLLAGAGEARAVAQRLPYVRWLARSG
jgi:3-isopropylmalate/(R)-2-methylmalate dehydratase small subunit